MAGDRVTKSNLAAGTNVPMPQQDAVEVPRVDAQTSPPVQIAQAMDSMFEPGWKLDSPNASLDTGFSCRGKLKDASYPKDVVLFVPPGFNPDSPTGSNLLMHFHGHLVSCKDGHREIPATFDGGVLDEFKFKDILASTGTTNSLLIVPESSGKNDDYKSYFTDPSKFEKFTGAVAAGLNRGGITGSSGIDSIYLSAHSGAERVIENTLQNYDGIGWREKIRGIALLDATYGSLSSNTVSSFLNLQDKQIQFLDVYQDGTRTAANSERILNSLGDSAYATKTTGNLNDGAAASSGFVALSPGKYIQHWDLVHQYLPSFWSNLQG
jgi:hypothetical protein